MSPSLLRRSSEYRLRRGPVLVLFLLLALAGSYVIGRNATRPQVAALGLVTVPQAYAGTTYSVDGVVCLRATSVGARVTGVTGGTSRDMDTRLVLRPAGAPPAFAFPVAPDAGRPLAGLRIPAGDEQCVRVLVTGRAQGEQRAKPVTVKLSYGPFGLLRTSRTVTPNVLLQVTGTGADPRAAA